jgi:hypothetical protein
VAGAISTGAVTSLIAAGIALGASGAATVRTNHGCYLVGQSVTVAGSGFAPHRRVEVAIDGVDFKQQTTDSAGGFRGSLAPGGLGANIVQSLDHLDATDGTVSADTSFTLTRTAGARFLAARGNPNTLRAPFQVWGFALDGHPRTAYVHYVSPSGSMRETVKLGRTGGQCGYLMTGRRRVFPFAPSRGSWTLQVDTRPSYTRHPHGPVSRIAVRIS